MRTPRCDSQSGLTKGPWSSEEDHKLKTYISRYGIWNWSKMPLYAGLSRSGKSCRLRWVNYLDPKVKRGNFTNEEEKTLLHYHSVLGNKWSAIAKMLPGRSDNEVKNYWHAHLKKQMTQDSTPVTKTKEITSYDVETPSESVDEFFLNISNDHTTSPCMLDTTSTFEPEVEFETNYNITSPGTLEEVESFWQQLYSNNEDFELQNVL
ncbi:hypothetical protein OSB04_028609 [Centaurea solstitialis]|uniref:Homeodomain-like protein n=1 Tax=Centaurea solstitialis TaxID=347529 RepID=A0AA38SNH0_9ASTR|nr:hypothetical protein OSB04_028609 [Centaurea solstitialis]